MSDGKIKSLTENQNLLGEGPMWSQKQNALFWVDIEAMQLHLLKDGIDRMWQFDEKLTAISETNKDELLLCFAKRLVLFNLKTESQTLLAEFETELPQNRANDGKSDPFGNFWVGSMCDDETLGLDSGVLWKIDGTGKQTKMLENIGISNTFAWDLERQKFYFADSTKGTIYNFDFNQDDQTIDNQAVFAKTKEGSGPDGSTIDADGYLWNCQWDGWRIVRYAPDGSVDAVINMPVARPTSCTFGGDDLDQLFITTASTRLSDDALQEQPMAGQILQLDPKDFGIETKGLPADIFKLKG